MNMTIPIIREREYDVAVIGGGTAGFTAAIAAARNGAKTAVIERMGMLGGTMTVGGVCAPALFHAHGRQIIGGIGWELMTRLAEKGYASLPKAPFAEKHPLLAVEINPLQTGCEMDDMALEAGVHISYHQTLVHAEAENGTVSSIGVITASGLERIRAKMFIDASGDGALCHMAGAEYEIGPELQPATLNFRLAGYTLNLSEREEISKKYALALESGTLQAQDIWGGGFGAFVSGSGRKENHGKCYQQNPGSNTNHVYPFNGADALSRTEGEIEGRRSIRRLLSWLNENVPGLENAYADSVSPMVTARESRRIIGNAYITGDDYINGVVPKDSVCYSFYPIDVHRGNTKEALDNEFHKEGLVPGIPYGALTAKGFSNLFMAGRIASGDRRAQSAYRVQASCMAMGEAAGTAAALCVKENCSASELDASLLQNTLSRQGAIVPGLE